MLQLVIQLIVKMIVDFKWKLDRVEFLLQKCVK